jgi:hypothetical protein
VVQQTSYSVGTGVLSVGDKRPELDVDKSPIYISSIYIYIPGADRKLSTLSGNGTVNTAN